MIIRKAHKSDLSFIAKIHVDTWNTSYKGIIPDEYLKGRSYKEQEQKWLQRIFDNPNSKEFMYAAENEEGKILGFASASIENKEETDSILYTIYILKEYQRQGIGKLLLKSIVKDLKTLKAKSMITWVFEDNPSRRFYEALGAKKFKEKLVNIRERDIKEIAYIWDDISYIFHI